MSWINQIKEALPDYAKDTKLNLDSVINRSSGCQCGKGSK